MSEQVTQPQAKLSHIAFIMDGNGRWAKKRGLPREHGHRHGVKAFEAVLKHCKELDIDTVTVYAFSTENWKRPQKEVDAIMKLMDHYLSECEKKSDEYDMRICFLGDKSPFEKKRRERMERLEALTAGKSRTLNIAFNYGGRAEIVNACNALIREGHTTITESDISNSIYTAHVCDPDLIVRTAGEFRISNFLLWQCAYSEFYISKALWPDFDKKELRKAIDSFLGRKRRYGGLNKDEE
jgi:undecaprenyl diphosphate synthase